MSVTPGAFSRMRLWLHGGRRPRTPLLTIGPRSGGVGQWGEVWAESTWGVVRETLCYGHCSSLGVEVTHAAQRNGFQ